MSETDERIDRNELARYRRRDMVPQGVESGNLLGYEHGDTNIGAVVKSMIIIFASVIVIMVLAAATFNYFSRREAALKDKIPSPLFAQQPVPSVASMRMLPSPLKGSNQLPWDAMDQERTVAEDEVNKEGSQANKKNGTIPIAQAMQEIAQQNGDTKGKGLPAYSTLTKRAPLYPPNVNFENQESRLNVEGSGGRVLDNPALRSQLDNGVPQSFPAHTTARGGSGVNTVNKAATQNKPGSETVTQQRRID